MVSPLVESVVVDGTRYNVVATLSTAAGEPGQAVLVDASGNPLVYLEPLSAFPVKGQKLISGATEILPANTNRIGALIRNLDATNVVYIGDSNAVLTTTGMPVSPGALTATAPVGSTFIIHDYVGPIWGIPSAGTPNVAYLSW